MPLKRYVRHRNRITRRQMFIVLEKHLLIANHAQQSLAVSRIDCIHSPMIHIAFQFSSF